MDSTDYLAGARFLPWRLSAGASQALPAKQPSSHNLITTTYRDVAGCGSCRSCGLKLRVHSSLETTKRFPQLPQGPIIVMTDSENRKR